MVELKHTSQIKYVPHFKQVSELAKLPGTTQLLKLTLIFECFAALGSTLQN